MKRATKQSDKPTTKPTKAPRELAPKQLEQVQGGTWVAYTDDGVTL